MIQLYVKCKNSLGEVVYEGVKKTYATKEEAFYDFRACIYNLGRNLESGQKFKHIWSHVLKEYSEDMKRCDYAIKIGQCRSFPYKVVYSLRGLNK